MVNASSSTGFAGRCRLRGRMRTRPSRRAGAPKPSPPRDRRHPSDAPDRSPSGRAEDFRDAEGPKKSCCTPRRTLLVQTSQLQLIKNIKFYTERRRISPLRGACTPGKAKRGASRLLKTDEILISIQLRGVHLDRHANKVACPLDQELVLDGGARVGHGLVGDAERIGDVGQAFALGQQPHDVELS